MKLKNSRLFAAGTAAAAMVAGLLTVQGAGTAMAAPVTETRSVNHQCVEDKGFWSSGSGTTVSPDNLTMTFPPEVHPGETFTVSIQPGPMKSTGKRLGSMKYDIELPQGVEISNLRVSGAGSNLRDVAPAVTRVGEDGHDNPNGPYARIWAEQRTVNNGPNSDDSRGGVDVGMRVAANQTFRLPQISFDVKAPDTAGATIAAGLRAAGNGPGPANNSNTANTLSFVAHANVADAVYCTPEATGRNLTSTRVVPRGTETSFADTSTDLEVTSGSGPTTLTANVTHTDGSPVTEGQVEFDFGDGSPRVAVDVAGGTATTTHTYPELDDRNPVPYTATARYLGVQGRTNPSEDATTVTVTPVPRDQVQATVALAASADPLAADNGTIPVELRATVGAEGDAELADGVEVVFYEGDNEIGRAATAGGVATLTTTVPDEAATRTFRAVVADFENETQEVTGAEGSVSVDIAPVSRTSLTLRAGEPVLVGQEATITATYSATPSIPAGTEVIFRADNVRIGTAIVDGAGTATLRHSFDRAGEKKITALVQERTVDGRRYPAARDSASLTVNDPAGQDTSTDLTFTRPDVDIEASILTGDTIRFVATVKTGDKPIREGATVSFFDGDTYLGNAPVDPATGEAVFEHRFAERGEHRVRAVFNGQEQKNAEGVTTDVLEPSTSEPVVLDVKAHEVDIENPEPTPDPDPEDPEDPTVPSPDPGSGSWGGSSGSSGSSDLFASIFGSLAGLGIIPRELLDLLGWNVR